MRKTITFILRLLVDHIEPVTLRGFIREVAVGQEYTFSSEQGLLESLRALLQNAANGENAGEIILDTIAGDDIAGDIFSDDIVAKEKH